MPWRTITICLHKDLPVGVHSNTAQNRQIEETIDKKINKGWICGSVIVPAYQVWVQYSVLTTNRNRGEEVNRPKECGISIKHSYSSHKNGMECYTDAGCNMGTLGRSARCGSQTGKAMDVDVLCESIDGRCLV